MKPLHAARLCSGIVLIVGCMISSEMLASEDALRTHNMSDDELEKLSVIATRHFGSNLVPADIFTYHDYHDRPVVYAVSFMNPVSDQQIGSVYVSVEDLDTREAVRGLALHQYPFENLSKWLQLMKPNDQLHYQAKNSFG